MKKYILVLVITGLAFITSCLDSDLPDPIKTLPFEEQLAIDIKLIDDYLSANLIEASVHDTKIRFVSTFAGTGDSPSANDLVKVKYKGQLLNGTVFDQNSDGITFPLANLITSWKIMIPEMKEGGKMTIYAPSVYCYGASGQGSIPANANLIFEIELLSIE